MFTVSEVSKLTGVSVRTLHHYDTIELLQPTEISAAGYRLYDESAISRLRDILIFRELKFKLSEIKTILNNKNIDRKDILNSQVELLTFERDRINRLISLAHNIIENGGMNMDFSAFDRNKSESYRKEAMEKWGATEAWSEFERKANKCSDNDDRAVNEAFMQIFTDIGRNRNLPPESKEIQALIERLRRFICDNYYNCTPEILHGLSLMYVSDERFKNTIDSCGGDGTTEYIKAAVEYYCKHTSK
ncbi:MAG: MerR family transcriptional regulator [Clostridiales bacterium]|nr:MerR family transcriptional regulator [Clostridiales bacterium]